MQARYASSKPPPTAQPRMKKTPSKRGVNTNTPPPPARRGQEATPCAALASLRMAMRSDALPRRRVMAAEPTQIRLSTHASETRDTLATEPRSVLPQPCATLNSSRASSSVASQMPSR